LPRASRPSLPWASARLARVSARAEEERRRVHRDRERPREPPGLAVSVQWPRRPRMKRASDAEWAEARRRCRLSVEDVRMAKELGMSPGGLIRNRPSPQQRWKAPVRVWVRELYRKRQEKMRARGTLRDEDGIAEDPWDVGQAEVAWRPGESVEEGN